MVTGASSGIGRATALLLAAAEVQVIANGRDSGTLAELEGCELIVGGLEDSTTLERLASSLDRKDSYPILVNCAGVAKFAPFVDVPLETWESHIQTNLLAPIRLCHAVAPRMVARGGGQIINVGSIAANHFFPGGAIYCTTKAALLAFGKGLAADYRREGLRVTTIMPGAVDTPIWGDSGPEKADMLSVQSVAEAIRDLVLAPSDRTVDELTIMPVKGFL